MQVHFTLCLSCWEFSDVVRFDIGPLLQGQTRIAKVKSAYNSLIIDPRGLRCENNLQEIMGWESPDMVRFNLGPLLQCETRIPKVKPLVTCSLLVLQVCNVKPLPIGNPGLGNFSLDFFIIASKGLLCLGIHR